MDKKNLSVSLVVGALAVVLSVLLGGTDVVKEIHNNTVGGASSVLPTSWFKYGDFESVRAKANVPGSSDSKANILCAIQAPSATSTLKHASIRLDSATATPIKFTFAAAASASATTTLIGGARLSIATSSMGVFSATTSGAWAGSLGSGRDITIPPNWYLVVDAWQDTALASNGVGITSSFNPGGACSAEFVVDGR